MEIRDQIVEFCLRGKLKSRDREFVGSVDALEPGSYVSQSPWVLISFNLSVLSSGL